MQEKSAFHQRKLGVSYPNGNKCRRLFVCLFLNGSLAWNQLGDVVSIGSSNVKAIDVESFVLFFPIAWKTVSPPPPNPCQASSCEQNFSVKGIRSFARPLEQGKTYIQLWEGWVQVQILCIKCKCMKWMSLLRCLIMLKGGGRNRKM